jgi:hypothetical protein
MRQGKDRSKVQYLGNVNMEICLQINDFPLMNETVRKIFLPDYCNKLN